MTKELNTINTSIVNDFIIRSCTGNRSISYITRKGGVRGGVFRWLKFATSLPNVLHTAPLKLLIKTVQFLQDRAGSLYSRQRGAYLKNRKIHFKNSTKASRDRLSLKTDIKPKSERRAYWL